MPARLTGLQPPSSVGSFVTDQTAMPRSANRCESSGSSSTIVLTVAPVKVFVAVSGRQSPLSMIVAPLDGLRHRGELRQVEVERIEHLARPDATAGVVAAADLGTRLAVGDAHAQGDVTAGVLAGQPMHGHRLPRAVGVVGELDAVGQVLVHQTVEVES